MKKLLLIITALIIFTPISNADDEHIALSTQLDLNAKMETVQNIRSLCSKTYQIGSENLFYIFLSALNQYNIKIEEIQSRTGTILFKINSKEFMVSISSKDTQNSYIKIIPADNNYHFSPVTIQKILSYIDMNNNTKFVNIL